MVPTDLIARGRLAIETFTLGTGRLPEEMHQLMKAVRVRYRLPMRASAAATCAR